jgi:hypothetical protein
VTNTSGVLCAATTSRGYRCINPASSGRVCPGHDPRNWCKAPTRNGPCKRRAASDGGPCSKHSGRI